MLVRSGLLNVKGHGFDYKLKKLVWGYDVCVTAVLAELASFVITYLL
jgi:hypothetical protein